MQVQQSLDQWLAGQIQVQSVNVVAPEDTPDASQLLIQIEYLLIETLSIRSLEVQVI
jgi:hypothetical protein